MTHTFSQAENNIYNQIQGTLDSLSNGAFRIFNYFLGLSNHHEVMFSSQTHIAAKCNLSRPHTNRLLRHLHTLGIIPKKRLYRPNNRSICRYTLGKMFTERNSTDALMSCFFKGLNKNVTIYKNLKKLDSPCIPTRGTLQVQDELLTKKRHQRPKRTRKKKASLAFEACMSWTPKVVIDLLPMWQQEQRRADNAYYARKVNPPVPRPPLRHDVKLCTAKEVLEGIKNDGLRFALENFMANGIVKKCPISQEG